MSIAIQIQTTSKNLDEVRAQAEAIKAIAEALDARARIYGNDYTATPPVLGIEEVLRELGPAEPEG